MKTVIISNLYPPYIRGGAEIIAQKMAEGLRDNLQHVVVVTTRPYLGLKTLRTEQITINGIPTYRYYPLNIYHYLNDYKHHFLIKIIWHIFDIFNVHTYFIVRKILLEEQPDAVITHNLMGIGFLIPRLIAKLKIKHLHVLHDVQLVDGSGMIIKGKESLIRKKIYSVIGYVSLMRFLFAKTKRIISPSKFLLDFYEGYNLFPQANKTVLQNPVTSRPRPPRVIKNDVLRLLYLGQITEAKGVVNLIKVIKKIESKNIELKVVGLGQDLKQIMEASKKDTRIRFYGWKNRAALNTIFADTDILILPTKCYDNSPTVVYEALSNGIPAIVSDVGGAKEIVKDGHNGWVFQTSNWLQLREILESLIMDRSRLEVVKKNAQSSIEHLTMNNYIGKLLDLIDK